MTDDEIIKALEGCGMNRECPLDCPYAGDGLCIDNSRRDALDLIKRQQAEIDRLKVESKLVQTNIYKKTLKSGLAEEARAEAIKEFVMKLKIYVLNPNKDFYLMLDEIDNLVKEMVGADNG